MSHIRVKGFVLRDQPIGDADRLITVLTADHGLITAAARGARRQKSSLLASTQIFAFSEFLLFQNRSRNTVDSAELIESFQGLHKDIYRLICAAHLAEVFIDVLKDDLPERSSYELWARSANEINRGQDPLLAIHISQLRLLADAGLRPPIKTCNNCGETISKKSLFSFSEQKIYCDNGKCGISLAGQYMRLSAGTMACLNHVFYSHLPQFFNFVLLTNIKEEVITFSERWLTGQMEKQYTRLDLLRDLED